MDIDKKLPDETYTKLYELFRKRIENQRDLIGQRMTHYLALQAFLVTPYIISFSLNHKEGLSTVFPAQATALQNIAPGIGIVMSVSTLVSITAAEKYVKDIEYKWNDIKHSNELQKYIIEIVPPLSIRWMGQHLPFLIITLVLCMWLYIIYSMKIYNNVFLYFAFVTGFIIPLYIIFYFYRRNVNKIRLQYADTVNSLNKSHDEKLNEFKKELDILKNRNLSENTAKSTP